MNLKKFYITISGVLLLVILAPEFSCNDPFQYNPNEVLLAEKDKNINQKNIDRIQSLSDADTLRFIVIADPHHDYEDLEEFVAKANAMEGIDFILIAGDITTFGLQTEFLETLNILRGFHLPFVTIIGNHDLLANGEKVYEEMFGKTDFAFTCKGNKFICLNSNSREYDFNGAVPSLDWLNQELINTAGNENIFVLCHVAPFHSDFDPDLEEGYSNSLANSGKVRLSMHGHAHDTYFANHYDDGVLYLVTDDMLDRGYSIITTWSDGIDVEQKQF